MNQTQAFRGAPKYSAGVPALRAPGIHLYLVPIFDYFTETIVLEKIDLLEKSILILFLFLLFYYVLVDMLSLNGLFYLMDFYRVLVSLLLIFGENYENMSIN